MTVDIQSDGIGSVFIIGNILNGIRFYLADITGGWCRPCFSKLLIGRIKNVTVFDRDRITAGNRLALPCAVSIFRYSRLDVNSLISRLCYRLIIVITGYIAILFARYIREISAETDT